MAGVDCRSGRRPFVVATGTDPTTDHPTTDHPTTDHKENVMRYALLICGDENSYAALSPDEAAAGTAEYGVFAAEMAQRGVLQGGERLRPTSDATTVRV